MHRSRIFVTWILLWAVVALAGCQLESGRDVGVPATAAQPSDLNFVEGKESFDKENWEDAVVEFSEVLKTNPRNALAFYYRGRSYIGLRRQSDAIRDLAKAVELDPGLTLAYYYRGRAYRGLGPYTEAVADLYQA